MDTEKGDSIQFPGWESSDDQFDSLFNFKWKPVSQGINFELISKHGIKQMVNHIEGHQNLTTKDGLYSNMRHHFESKGLEQNIYDILPLTFVIDY